MAEPAVAVTQFGLEVAVPDTDALRVSQFGLEVAIPDADEVRVSQFGIEVALVEATGHALITQFGLEVAILEGEPGPAPTPGPEICECCMATQLEIWNDALMKLGVSQIVINVDEASKEAQLSKRLYPKALKETLRSHPWQFATKYAKSVGAAAGGAMELVEGSEETPVNGDWRYAYRYPADCVMARRVIPNAFFGRQYNRTPIPWRPGRTTTFGETDDYQLIFTNEKDAVLEYTALVECRIDFNDALFEDALSSRLAWKLAPSLVQDKKTATECLLLFKQAISDAAVVDMREQQQHPDGDQAAWNEGRG